MNKDVKTILKELVNIKSNPAITNKEIVNYIQQCFEGYEQEIIKQQKGELELYNFIINIPSKNPKRKPILVLMHTDTVKGDWFSKAEIYEDKLVGLGSCDMKAGISAIISAVLDKDYDKDIILAFSSDEETSGKGAILIKEKLKNKQFGLIILPEPTTNICYTSQNSCIGYRVKTKGISMHGSLNDIANNNNNNALTKMNQIINYLNQVHEKDKDLASQNIGYINSNGSGNIVPSECVLKFEQRFKPGINIKEKFDYYKTKIEEHKGDVELTFFGDYFNMKDKEVEKNLKNILKKFNINRFERFLAWSEGGIIKELGPCIVLGPGRLDVAHTKKEYVNLNEVEKYKDIYKEVFELL
ncbi:MAG: M20/M25/M40 family metallo-hydrolase [Candidatus Woesearchaeota archaeon]